MSVHDRLRLRVAWGLALFYAAAGVLHIAVPGPFLSITPAWVPHAPLVIFMTGVCEIAGAVGLCIRRLRRFAGVALALYAVCVFPANVKHAIDSLGSASPGALAWLYHIVRLPLQPVLVWLPLFAASWVTWPLREERRK